MPCAALLHRQPDAQPEGGALLRSETGQWRDGVRRRADQDLPVARDQDSPPYLHDDRLLTLEDTVEFFNLVLERKLSAEEKGDLVAYLRTL